MKLRCSRCRKAWIDVADGRCASCGFALGTEDHHAASSDEQTVLKVEVVEELTELEEVLPTGGKAPPAPSPMTTQPMGRITAVTGSDAVRHHGIPERVPGVSLTGLSLTPFEGYLLSLVDGATSVDDVVAASNLNMLEAAVAFENLKYKGIIRFRTDVDSTAGRRTSDGRLKAVEESVLPKDRAAKLAKVGLTRVSTTPSPMEAPKMDEDPQVQLTLARSARDQGDLPRAREHARLAWMTAPDLAEAAALMEELESPRFNKQRARLLHDLGAQAQKAGDYLAAIRHYQNALAEFEPSAVIHHKVALVQILAGVSPDEAEKHLLRALELQPDNAIYLNNLQRLRERMRAQGAAAGSR